MINNDMIASLEVHQIPAQLWRRLQELTTVPRAGDPVHPPCPSSPDIRLRQGRRGKTGLPQLRSVIVQYLPRACSPGVATRQGSGACQLHTVRTLWL